MTYFLSAVLTTTPAFLPMAEVVRLIRFRVIGSPVCESVILKNQPVSLLCGGLEDEPSELRCRGKQAVLTPSFRFCIDADTSTPNSIFRVNCHNYHSDRHFC